MLLLFTMILIAGGAVGSTVAWLIANTTSVVNTFTYGDIKIELIEEDSGVDDDGDQNTNDYEMVPGAEIEKNPTITVSAGSEECWLFVKLEKAGTVSVEQGDGTTKSYGFDDYLTYSLDNDWTQLYDEQNSKVEGVYYLRVNFDTGDFVHNVLKDDKITVLDSVEKPMLDALDRDTDAGSVSYPQLTVTAYAVQYVGFEPETSTGASAPTEEQTNAAALKAWNVIADD